MIIMICDDLCPIVNFSPWLRICSWLELRGEWIVSYVPKVREEQMVRICLYVHVHVFVVPPMIMTGVVLWQLFEYIFSDSMRDREQYESKGIGDMDVSLESNTCTICLCCLIMLLFQIYIFSYLLPTEQ